MSDEFGMLPALPPQDPTSRVPGQLSGIYWPTHERTPDASVLYRWREGGATPDWLQPDGADRQAGRRRTVRGWPNIDRTLGGPQADE